MTAPSVRYSEPLTQAPEFTSFCERYDQARARTGSNVTACREATGYTPRHMAPTAPEYVVLCHPHQLATHQPFASVDAAHRWVNLEHPHCPGEHRVIRASVIEGHAYVREDSPW